MMSSSLVPCHICALLLLQLSFGSVLNAAVCCLLFGTMTWKPRRRVSCGAVSCPCRGHTTSICTCVLALWS